MAINIRTSGFNASHSRDSAHFENTNCSGNFEIFGNIATAPSIIQSGIILRCSDNQFVQ